MSSFDSPNPHRVSNFYSPPPFLPPIVPIPPTTGKQRQHITINHPSISQRFNPSHTPRQAARITLYPTPRLFLPDLEKHRHSPIQRRTRCLPPCPQFSVCRSVALKGSFSPFYEVARLPRILLASGIDSKGTVIEDAGGWRSIEGWERVGIDSNRIMPACTDYILLTRLVRSWSKDISLVDNHLRPTLAG